MFKFLYKYGMIYGVKSLAKVKEYSAGKLTIFDSFVYIMNNIRIECSAECLERKPNCFAKIIFVFSIKLISLLYTSLSKILLKTERSEIGR